MATLGTLQIIMPVINDLVGDQRVHRMATTLWEMGYKVRVIGRKLPHSPPLNGRKYECIRMKLWFTKGKLFYLEYNFRLAIYLWTHSVDIIHANDLDTLLASYLVSKIKSVPLVYDSHEYFTEVPELIHRRFTRYIWLTLERWIFPKLRYAYTVNESIAHIYSQKYGVEVRAIRNVPFKREDKHPLLYPEKRKSRILIYQGSLNIGRGLEMMIEAMQYLPHCVLWIIGRGDIEMKLREHATAQPFPDRVIFKGFIPQQQLHTYTLQADLGLSLEKDMGENYRLASPNKVYDYIQAGVPVIVSDLPEMRRIVETYQVGEILRKSDYSPEKLGKTIQNILNDTSRYNRYVDSCIKTGKVLNWENEKDKLRKLYQELTANASPRALA